MSQTAKVALPALLLQVVITLSTLSIPKDHGTKDHDPIRTCFEIIHWFVQVFGIFCKLS